MARIVIAGCGYVGTALGLELASEGHEVFGLRRDPSRLPRGIQPLQVDLGRRDSLLVLPEQVDFAVYCAAPSSGDEAAYRLVYLDGLERFLRALQDQGEKPKRVFFTSSTSVYAQQRGEWIDETSPANPRRPAGEILVLAERLLLASGFDTTIVRFGGIYGPGRTRLIQQVERGEAQIGAEPHFTNRIHRDDAAGLLRHLISVRAEQSVYLGVDCEPADEADVLRFLADELGVGPPPRRAAEAASPARRAGSKRCRNQRALATGYRYHYPSYRVGYPAVVQAYLQAREGLG